MRPSYDLGPAHLPCLSWGYVSTCALWSSFSEPLQCFPTLCSGLFPTVHSASYLLPSTLAPCPHPTPSQLRSCLLRKFWYCLLRNTNPCDLLRAPLVEAAGNMSVFFQVSSDLVAL